MSNRRVPRYIIGTDVETSGANIPGQISPEQTPSQCLSIGVIIIDTQRPGLPEVASFYREIRFDPTRFNWEDWTTDVHGLTHDNLADKPTMALVASELIRFLSRYVNTLEPQVLMAHNPGFDRAFLLQVLEAGGYTINLAYRMIDAFSLGFGHYGLHNTNEQFAFMGTHRGNHNALQDIRLVADMLRLVRSAGNRKLVSAGLPPAETPEYARDFVREYLRRRLQQAEDFRGLVIYYEGKQESYRWCEYMGMGNNEFTPLKASFQNVVDRMLADGLFVRSNNISPEPIKGHATQHLKPAFLNID